MSQFEIPTEIWYPDFWKEHLHEEDGLYNPFGDGRPQSDWAFLFFLFTDPGPNIVFRWEWAPHPVMLASYAQYVLMKLYVERHHSWVLDGAMPENLRNYTAYYEAMAAAMQHPADASERERFELVAADIPRVLKAFELLKIASTQADRTQCFNVFVSFTELMASQLEGFPLMCFLYSDAADAIEAVPKMGVWGDEAEVTALLGDTLGIGYSELLDEARAFTDGKGAFDRLEKFFTRACTHKKYRKTDGALGEGKAG
jgi:hypothetical protein